MRDCRLLKRKQQKLIQQKESQYIPNFLFTISVEIYIYTLSVYISMYIIIYEIKYTTKNISLNK